MGEAKISYGEGFALSFTVFEFVEVGRRDTRFWVEQYEEHTGPVLWSPWSAGRLTGDELVSCICRWLEHLCEGDGVVKDARNVFKDCDCDL